MSNISSILLTGPNGVLSMIHTVVTLDGRVIQMQQLVGEKVTHEQEIARVPSKLDADAQRVASKGELGVYVAGALTRGVRLLQHLVGTDVRGGAVTIMNNTTRAEVMESIIELTASCEALADVIEHDLKVVPVHLRRGLANYIERGVETGGFLRAVLENDLAYAVATADASSLRGLKSVVDYLRSDEVPAMCWGTKEKVSAWLAGNWRSAELNQRRDTSAMGAQRGD